MAYTLVGGPFWRLLDDDGVPLAGGKLYVYTAGTTTPVNSYSDALGVTPNANPVILDAGGRPDTGAVYLPTGTYKMVLIDVDDAPIATQDDYEVVDPS